MKGRGSIKGGGNACELVVEASFGDYGRNDNPTLTISGDSASVVLELADPDAARLLGERLFDLARKAEIKLGQRGPEYRARLAREEALEELRVLTRRVEAAMGVESPVEGIHVMTASYGQPDRRPAG